MFENYTYEELLEQALSKVTNDVDKRQGSIIYDGIAPCTFEISNFYFVLNNFIDLLFVDTCVGEYLDRRCYEKGVVRKKATYAVRMVETNKPIELGVRFGIEDLIYTVTTQIDDTHYHAVCNTLGTVGNLYDGAMLDNIDNLNGVSARLTDIIDDGEDEEDDESLRNRYYVAVRASSGGGTKSDYEIWALEVTSCGACRVFPLYYGAGTVRIQVVDTNKEINQRTVNEVNEYIQTRRPICADVRVEAPLANNITINAKVITNGTRSLSEIQTEFTNKIKQYFQTLVFNETQNMVHFTKVGAMLLDCEGVTDYSDLTLNDETHNITIGSEEVPVLTSINLS